MRQESRITIARIRDISPIPSFTNDGGDLGQDGQGVSGGAAGAAIQTNGYTITYVESGAGDIRGAIL